MLKQEFVLHNNDLLVTLSGNLLQEDLQVLKNYIIYFRTTYNIKNIIFDTRDLIGDNSALENL